MEIKPITNPKEYEEALDRVTYFQDLIDLLEDEMMEYRRTLDHNHEIHQAKAEPIPHVINVINGIFGRI